MNIIKAVWSAFTAVMNFFALIMALAIALVVLLFDFISGNLFYKRGKPKRMYRKMP